MRRTASGWHNYSRSIMSKRKPLARRCETAKRRPLGTSLCQYCRDTAGYRRTDIFNICLPTKEIIYYIFLKILDRETRMF